MPVGVPLATEAQFVDGAAVPHGGDHILQDAPIRVMEEDVVGDDGQDAGLGGEV
jgi:hypothetical protein